MIWVSAASLQVEISTGLSRKPPKMHPWYLSNGACFIKCCFDFYDIQTRAIEYRVGVGVVVIFLNKFCNV